MEITTTMVIGSVVNLGAFFGLAYYLGKKPIAAGLSGRTERVAALLRDAESQMAQMTAKLAEQKQQLGDIQTQVNEILENGKGLSQKLAQEVVEGARAEGEQLRQRAQREIESEIQLTRQKLRHELGREAVKQAEKILAERLDAGKQTQLIHDFANTIPSAKPAGGNGHGDN